MNNTNNNKTDTVNQESENNSTTVNDEQGNALITGKTISAENDVHYNHKSTEGSWKDSTHEPKGTAKDDKTVIHEKRSTTSSGVINRKVPIEGKTIW